MNSAQLCKAVTEGAFDRSLEAVYAPDRDRAALDAARSRAAHVAARFVDTFGALPDASFFSAPGRTELCGNHTDHQHGRVLCASVNLDMLCCAAPNGTNMIRVLSEGYPAVEVGTDSLIPREEERSSSAALVRGVAAKIAELGYSLKGFDAYIASDVLSGSGLSSSAAYEILMGNILNHFCCGSAMDAVQLAKAGQYAENVYFGKPCGLMDQIGSSVGGAVSIDFADPAVPVVRRVDLDLRRMGYALCILDSRASHAGLTPEYAAIPEELKAVCRCFGKEFLREVPESDFLAAVPSLRIAVGDRAVLRAMHYYAEDGRAAVEAEALRLGDFERFLTLVRASGHSSAEYLQNVVPAGQIRDQALLLTIALAENLLEGRGAVRVHGGGFAGTAQAFVPLETLDLFKSNIEAALGAGICHAVTIRPMGGIRLA